MGWSLCHLLIIVARILALHIRIHGGRALLGQLSGLRVVAASL